MIVYVAHKLRGDIPRNTFIVRKLLAQITRECPLIIPIAPYLTTLQYLDDSDDDQRYMGMLINRAHFTKRFIDQLHVYGERSPGVETEIMWAVDMGIPVYFFDVPQGILDAADYQFNLQGSKL